MKKLFFYIKKIDFEGWEIKREPTNRHTRIDGLGGGRMEEEGCLEGFGERREEVRGVFGEVVVVGGRRGGGDREREGV